MRQRDSAQHHRGSGGSDHEGEHCTALHIQLLGQFHVTAEGRAIPDSAWRIQKARSLIKILCLAPRHQLHREQVIDLLWPESDSESVSGNLRSVVYGARRALDSVLPADSPSFLQLRQDVFVLNTRESITIDVDLFNAAAEVALQSRDPRAFQTALELYTGDLLPEDRYEDWAAPAREELRERYLRLLVSLALLHESRSELDAGISVLERAVATDATHEDAHGGLMRLYAAAGRHGQAMRQFARLREVLMRELDVEPSGAIRKLHAEIAAGQFAPERQLRHADDGPASDHNLPALLTRFIGRRAELREINASLRDARLVTLVGPGGSGKSRLAVEAAREMVPHAGVVRLVELAALSDPALVPGAVAAAFGVMESTEQSVVDALVKTIGERSSLLVLDNCEHLIDACAGLVETLLEGAPGLRILATSREALRIPGEVLWRVAPLPLPKSANGDPPELESLTANDAVALFIDRARWVRPGFALTAENAAAITQICHRLDGMPLALELAAARSSVLSPEQLAERLDDALRLLSEGSRTAPDRQQTLRATLDWSYALLSPAEQALLQRLAVFAGGWTLDAAEAVCSTPAHADGGEHIERPQVLSLLANLVDKSLVQVEDRMTGVNSDIVPGIRYSLLETVRQYAAEYLVAPGKANQTRSQHADFYLELSERAEPDLVGPDQIAWLTRLEQEHDNLRTALSWLAEHKHIERESRMCTALMRFWYYHGYLVEGTQWIDSVLERSGSDAIPKVRRARLLQGNGMLAWNRGNVALAEDLSRQALSLFQEAGERNLSAGAFHSIGVVAEMQNNYPEARRNYQEALALREEIGDVTSMAISLHSLGNVARELGDLDEAAELYERELALHREADNTRGEALALSGLGVVALDRCDYVLSETLSRKSHELYKALGTRSLNPMVCQNIGFAALYQGKYEQAMAFQMECLQITASRRDMRGIAYGIEGVATTLPFHDPTARGARAAARLFGAAERLRSEIDVPLPPADRALMKHPLAVAQNTLGGLEFDQAFEAGQRLSFEEAIAEALSVITSLVPDSEVQDAPVTPLALSRRERQVTELLAQGQTNAQIAAALNIARPTVDKHVSNILRKLGFSSRSDVRAWAIEHGIVPDDNTPD